MYNSFEISSEETDYELYLSGYNATASTLEDGFAAGGHINAKFATFDRDHNNCASQYTGGNAPYLKYSSSYTNSFTLYYNSSVVYNNFSIQ